MRPKYKVTGCARFFIFFLIFIPAVFFGAAYIRGENGLEIIREYYHKMIGGSPSSTGSGNDTEVKNVEDLQKQLKEAREEIRKLRREIEEKEQEIEKLKSGNQ